MNALVVFGIVLVGAFALTFFTKRRFGVLGLALCAGSLLSASWASTLTPFIEQQGLTLVSPPLSAVVAAMLIVLPPVLLLFSGPTYHNTALRVLGSIFFAVMTVVFMLPALGSALVFDDISEQIYQWLILYSNGFIVAGIILAVGDLLLTHTPHLRKKDR